MFYLCCRYTSAVRADIGKYACQHGTWAASAHFSRKLRSKSTIHSIKLAYLKRLNEKGGDSSDDEIAELPPKKRGRPLLLGKNMDEQLQLYLKKIRDQGGIVTASVAVAAARGIVMAVDRRQLTEFGGHIKLSREWAYSLLARMKFGRRKATTAKSKHTLEDFAAVKQAFLDDVAAVATMEDVPPEVVLNWDQTGIHLVPASTWTMDKGKVQMRWNLWGQWQMTNHCSFLWKPHWWFSPTAVDIRGQESTLPSSVQVIGMWPTPPSIGPRNKQWSNTSPRSLFPISKPSETPAINKLLEANTIHVCLFNIHVCLLPPNPMDVAVNKPAKSVNLNIGTVTK